MSMIDHDDIERLNAASPWAGSIAAVLRVPETRAAHAAASPWAGVFSAARGCDHALPAFDAEAARGLSADEVRRRWPRGHGRCHSCGAWVITYASPDHYAAGDW